MAVDPLIGVAAITSQGLPSSEQLKLKLLAIPSPLAADAVDLRLRPMDSICIAANMKLGSPIVNFDLSGSNLQIPTKGSVLASNKNVVIQNAPSFSDLMALY